MHLADIVRRFARDYEARFGGRLLPSHARTLADIAICRTPECGGHYLCCDDCGEQRFVPHSCRNRHCPRCGAEKTDAWLAARREELLETGYFHLVFTLPSALRALCRRHQKAAYGLLMRTAFDALEELAADPRHVGGRLAALAVLHTWTRALVYHPHVHLLVPAGGLAPDGRWQPSNPAYLVPVRALSRLFRGKLLARLAKALPDEQLPASVRRQEWVVYCRPAPRGGQRLLDYLGRYLQRTAIGERALIASDETHVTFRYRDEQRTGWRTLTLPGEEFLRRFLQHVLPRGCHRVRYYGLWHPANRAGLRQIAAQLALRAAAGGQSVRQAPPEPSSWRSPRRCAACGSERVRCIGIVYRIRQPP